MASLILQVVWMAMNRARTLGIHFGNNRLQAELMEDIQELLEEPRGYRLRG